MCFVEALRPVARHQGGVVHSRATDPFRHHPRGSTIRAVSATQELWRLGGAATTAELLGCVGRKALDRAVREGAIVRRRRGQYCLPDRIDHGKAGIVRGAVSHLSAAEYWDLGVLAPPEVLHVTVARHRSRVTAPPGVRLHYADLSAEERARGLTGVVRTILDCARMCPVPQALAIADTALRTGLATPQELREAAAELHGPGSRKARRIASWADPRSSSPLESALRGLLLSAGMTNFEPQCEIRRGKSLIARVDLGDLGTGVLLEADSFYWHGQRAALVRDCRRYDDLVAAGYVVLRFSWEHVLGEPDWVVSVVRAVLAARRSKR
jgi:very-short-patch-repair endonuclease